MNLLKIKWIVFFILALPCLVNVQTARGEDANTTDYSYDADEPTGANTDDANVYDVSAQSSSLLPLVQCGNTSNYADRCTLCHLIEGMSRIIKWGMQILVVCALLGIVAGGIMYIISAGNSGMMESAKGLIKQALWGVVLVLGAWVIVNTVLWMIGSKIREGGGGVLGISNWYSFKCDAPSGGGDDGGGGGDDGDDDDDGIPTCTYTYSAWDPEPCAAGQTQNRTETKTPDECEGGTRQPTTRECSTGAFDCAGNNCTQPDSAIANNKYGVDANILKSIVQGGEGCNPAKSSDGHYSCGYGQVTAKNRAWCGITGTAAETCTKVQQDVNLDINCAAKLIKEGNRRCNATDINVVASCYNAGQPGKCAVTTNNYCTRVSNYYNNCNQ